MGACLQAMPGGQAVFACASSNTPGSPCFMLRDAAAERPQIGWQAAPPKPGEPHCGSLLANGWPTYLQADSHKKICPWTTPLAYFDFSTAHSSQLVKQKRPHPMSGRGLVFSQQQLKARCCVKRAACRSIATYAGSAWLRTGPIRPQLPAPWCGHQVIVLTPSGGTFST